MRIAAVAVMALASGAFAQQPPPNPPSPAPTFQQLPPSQPPPQIARPSEVVKPGELPKPVGKQCIKERTAPCTLDPKRECKVMEIAEC